METKEATVECSLFDSLTIPDRSDTAAGLDRLNGRMRSMFERFIGSVGEAFTHRLGIACRLKAQFDCRTIFADSSREWQLRIVFRLFQRNLRLVLPLELVGELTALLLKRERSAVLGALSKDDVAALSYLFASILAEDPLFAAQRVYLASVVAGKSADPPAKPSESCAFEISVRLAENEYVAGVEIDPQLCSRFEAYSKTFAPDDVLRRPWIRCEAAAFAIELNYRCISLEELLSLETGSRIQLGRNASWKLRSSRDPSGSVARMSLSSPELSSSSELCLKIQSNVSEVSP